MSDYFERVEEQLRAATRRRAHISWLGRLRGRVSRPAAAATVAVGLVAAGSALAASGVFRTGEPIGGNVPSSPNAYEGVALGKSVRLLDLQVADPQGGPPWGLRLLRTSRGLECLQVGRLVDNRIGVLGEDGAFKNDGLFHPLSSDFVQNGACGAEDGHGDAFLTRAPDGIPENGLLNGQAGRAAEGGCEERASGCPAHDLRAIYYGLLGPDAVSVTYTTPSGALVTTPTAGADGAYLIVEPDQPELGRGHLGIGLPVARWRELWGRRELSFDGDPQIIRAVTYRDGHTCKLPTTAESHNLDHMGCPLVGYVARPSPHYTDAQLASAVSAHVVTAKHFCGKGAREEKFIPCDHGVPAGYRPINTDHYYLEPVLLVVEFHSRVAIKSDQEYYDVHIAGTDYGPDRAICPTESTAEIQRNLTAGQLVRFTTLVDAACPGPQIRVGFIDETGPGTVGGLSASAVLRQLLGYGQLLVGRTEVQIP